MRKDQGETVKDKRTAVASHTSFSSITMNERLSQTNETTTLSHKKDNELPKPSEALGSHLTDVQVHRTQMHQPERGRRCILLSMKIDFMSPTASSWSNTVFHKCLFNVK